MKRIKTNRILGTFGVMSCLATPSLAQGLQVEVNGQPVYFQGTRPQMIGGRVMVPLRGVLEQIGAYVDWDARSRTVSARKDDVDIQMRIGQRAAVVNGRTAYLDAPAQIIRGSTMVPLRFMSEALGAEVDWIAQTGTVRISTMDVSASPNYPPTFPPYRPPVTARPAINSFHIEAPYDTFRTGDKVRIELRGTPAADVHFSVPGVTGTKRMREESPGLYVAEWTVPPEANGLRESAIVAKLLIGGEERTIRGTDSPGNTTPADRTAPTISGMEPSNGERIGRVRPMIRVRVSDASGLDTDSWRLTLDGDDVTDQATYTNGMITFQPTNRLARGIHTVELSIQDRSGNRASSSWQFEVTRDTDSDRRDFSFTHNAPSNVREGDVITFTLRAEPGARVTYSIGNLVVDRAMSETSRGVYTATHRVRRTDDFSQRPIVARVRLDDGTSYTVEADPILSSPVSSRTPSTPVITAPTGTRVGNSMILRARSADAERYEVRVDYVTTVLGGLRLNGTVHQRTYEADSRGELNTDSINLDVPAGGSNTEYTITVTAIGANGVRSEPARMVVRR